MDWQVVIERNGAALRRVLAALVAMSGFDCRFAPEAQSAGGTATGGEGRDAAGGSGDPAGSRPEGRPTLPRRLHRAVLRLLRPAESAARRLIVVAARTLPETPPASDPARPARHTGGRKDNAAVAVLRSLGIAVVLPPSAVPAPRRAVPAVRRAPTAIALPLVDRLRNPGAARPRTVLPHAAPRILSFEGAVPHRLPPPPTPDDPLDATRLVLRLRAVAAALDDLPRQARRFVRLQALRARARARGQKSRISPLRVGRPPGQFCAASRRPRHEIHEILRDLNHFAHEALPDTS
ncbi:hypothetical protein ABGN05_04430 [Aquibium sp. LZ166]|uniref:Uncharacterized protein n=1 Tax=Aquibium pacificus TaxID=3153579 RepID=A0ABV3SDZ5_9HYPH